jgi:AcrR family transcriptional regulator
MPAQGTYAKGTARREEILNTALDVISTTGYHRASLRAIGRELGIEPAHILYYFGSRENLLREVITRWGEHSHALNADDADALEVYVRAIRKNLTIRGVVHLYLAFATEAVDQDHPAHSFFRDRFEHLAQELAATLERGIEQGIVRPELDPGRTARLLIALADGLQLQSLLDVDMDVPGDLEFAIDDLFVKGRRLPIDRPANF